MSDDNRSVAVRRRVLACAAVAGCALAAAPGAAAGGDPSVGLSALRATNDSYVSVSGHSSCEDNDLDVEYYTYQGVRRYAGGRFAEPNGGATQTYKVRFRVPADARPGPLAVDIEQECAGGSVGGTNLTVIKSRPSGRVSSRAMKRGATERVTATCFGPTPSRVPLVLRDAGGRSTPVRATLRRGLRAQFVVPADSAPGTAALLFVRKGDCPGTTHTVIATFVVRQH